MRVDFVITELYFGGAERCLTDVAIGLREGGDDVRVFSLGSLPQGEQRILVDRLEAAGIPVESGTADSPLHFYRAYRRLTHWLASSKPDIAQTFLYHANTLGTYAARAAGVGTRIGGLRVAELKPLRCRIESRAVRHMHSLVCVSAAVQEFAATKLGCPRDKSIVIPNGVDLTRFASAAPIRWSQIGWPDDSIVSLFVGRLHPQKGVDLLQQQVDVLAAAGTKRRLLIVGDGPLRPAMQAWAQNVGGDRVQILPWRRDIAPLMRACRVLVLPSRYEGMPNVVLEAMAAGRPVVCSRVEGSEELLSHDFQRQSFEPERPEAIKNLVDPLLDDEVLSDQIGRENQRRVKNDYSMAAMVDAYRRHYRMLRTRRLDVD